MKKIYYEDFLINYNKEEDILLFNYEKHLKNYGIKLPIKESINYAVLLIMIRHGFKKIISKSELSKYLSEDLNYISNDVQQARHLSNKYGFNILTRNDTFNESKLLNGYVLECLTKSSKSFYFSYEKRKTSISNNDFETLKLNYDYKCASCGSEENKVNNKNGKITILEKGHMNPDKDISNNCIPMFSYCNKIYKDKYIFNSLGIAKFYRENNYSEWIKLP